MAMEFDGSQKHHEANATAEPTNVTPLRKPRGSRTQNKVAAKAEALKEGTSFEYDGKTYHLPPADLWDLDVMEKFAEGDALGAVKDLLEPEQYNAFKTDADGNKKKRTMRDLGELLDVAMKSMGVEPGESNS